MKPIPLKQHNIEIQQNMQAWHEKPLLRLIYKNFYEQIIKYLPCNHEKLIIELGSGVGGFKNFYQKCIATDIFPNPWIDQVESTYSLSFGDGSASAIVMFDVFHHVEFPGAALKECHRVLVPGGRVIIFEPYLSLLGFFVYGILHKEPVAITKKIQWTPSKKEDLSSTYYAAQGNATRIFRTRSLFQEKLSADWNIITRKRFSAISYILSGGFSKPSFYPRKFLPVIRAIERYLDIFPTIFATRTLVILEKK